MDKYIFLHFYPGARGDFLASVMFDRFNEGQWGRVTRPRDTRYLNVHVTEDFSFLDRPNTITMRIDAGVTKSGKWTGKSSRDLLQTCHNWFTKHLHTFGRNPHYMTMETAEQYYHCAHYYMKEDQLAEKYMDRYNYWVDFADLFNFDYLNNLRTEIFGSGIPEATKLALFENMDKQDNIESTANSEIILQVQRLIDQELSSGVFLSHEWDHVPVLDKLELLKD